MTQRGRASHWARLALHADGPGEREPVLGVGPGPAQPATTTARTSEAGSRKDRRERRIISSSYVHPPRSVPGC